MAFEMRPELNRIAEKAMAEPAYLDRVLADPAAAGREVGVELTPEEIAHMRPLDPRQARDLLATDKSGC
jgi:hypothetical protein